MTDRSILERNKAVLWARDVVSRPRDCLIAFVANGGGDSVSVTTMEGAEIARCALSGSGVDAFTRTVQGKELVAIGLPDNVELVLRGKGVVVHNVIDYYNLYMNPTGDKPVTVEVGANDAVRWLRDMLTKMSGSSLVLDQADTGAGKWTSSHFKPNAGMLDKLKSFING